MNRRAFMTRGRRLILRHQRSTEPLCLLFLDLDRFKSLNDRFGHAGGDDVLVKFVAAVHENIRPGDFLFRIGGEEFCCVLPGTQIEQAVSVAQRVRQEFAAYPINLNGTQVKATVSIGVAATETFGYDPDELLRQADRAAYEAKEQGRNRVIVATSPASITLAAE
jgi:diguanylate cyclase (GGDEF)-like protein